MWCYDASSSAPWLTAADNGREDGGAPDRHAKMPVDIESALQALIKHIHSGDNQISTGFSVTQPLIAARAPGRLDVMGGIADYSGSTVLQLPLEESTVVFCQHDDKPEFTVVSQSSGDDIAPRMFSMSMGDFFEHNTGTAHGEGYMHEYFSALAVEHQWAAYVAGVLTVLMQHCQGDITMGRGIVLYVSSTVPLGKGVSSSAALEVAVMRALCALFYLDISSHQQAILCQRVENRIVGAPCGLMDQMASSCGQRGSLLNMLCQPDIVNNPVKLPDGLSLWGVDSGIRHAVSGADYSSVRVAAFMGYRYMLDMAGIADRTVAAADVKDLRWNGYLANVSVSEYLQRFDANLPDNVLGRDFLKSFDGTTDTITRVDPDVVYAVRACTAHPIQEHFRARLFIQLATTAQALPDSEPLAKLMGECMYQSHASYSNCGLDSHGTDDLVARFNTTGHAQGIYGARITGGGSGGVVAILARSDADSLVRSIAGQYAGDSGLGGYVFSGSSAGASVVSLTPTTSD